MTEIFEVLEMADATGKGVGKFRYTRRTDDPVTEPVRLCDHEHGTREEAERCPVAAAKMGRHALSEPVAYTWEAANYTQRGDGRGWHTIEVNGPWEKKLGWNKPDRTPGIRNITPLYDRPEEA